MSVELICPGCQRLLRVSVDSPSQRVRCPVCSALFDVAPGPGVPAAPAPATPQPRWHLRIPEGLTYGPIGKDELDRWVVEGRVTAECQVREEGQSAWLGAAAIYPVLSPAAVLLAADARPAARNASPSPVPQAVGRRVLEPHRGAVILALGILSWVSCPVFGLIAWIMGNADLNRMRAGRMEMDGFTLTQAGRLLGLIHVLLIIVAFGVVVPVLFLFWASVRMM